MDIRILRNLTTEQMIQMGYEEYVPIVHPQYLKEEEEEKHDTQPSQFAKYPPVISFRISDDMVNKLNEITHARDKVLQDGMKRMKHGRRYKNRVTRAFIVEQLIKTEYNRMKEEGKL